MALDMIVDAVGNNTGQSNESVVSIDNPESANFVAGFFKTDNSFPTLVYDANNPEILNKLVEQPLDSGQQIGMYGDRTEQALKPREYTSAFTIIAPNKRVYSSMARRLTYEYFKQLGYDEEKSFDLSVVVSELTANVVNHAPESETFEVYILRSRDYNLVVVKDYAGTLKLDEPKQQETPVQGVELAMSYFGVTPNYDLLEAGLEGKDNLTEAEKERLIDSLLISQFSNTVGSRKSAGVGRELLMHTSGADAAVYNVINNISTTISVYVPTPELSDYRSRVSDSKLVA